MAVPIGLVYIEGATKTEPIRQTLVNKNVEVPVDVAQAQRRELIPELIIDPVGRDMDVPGLQKFKNTLALFTLPQLCCHEYNIVNGTTVVNES